MKRMLRGLGIVVLGAIFIGQACGDDNGAGSPVAPAGPPPGMSSLLPPPDLQFDVTPLYGNDQAGLRKAREDALQANPDLAAEFDAVANETKAWQDKLDLDLVKEDPNMASIIPKIRVGREIQEAAAKGTPIHVDISQAQMSQQEWQEENNAEMATRKSDPDLEAQHQQWMQRKAAAEQRLEVAMVEVDPDISPMLKSTRDAQRRDEEAMINGPAPVIPDIDAMAARMKLHQDLYQQIRDQGFAAFAKEAFMLPAEDMDRVKALIRIEAYLSVWGDFYGEGMDQWAAHVAAYEMNRGINSIFLTMVSAERELDGKYTLNEDNAKVVGQIVEKFAASDYPAEWKLTAWQVAIANVNNFRALGISQPDSPTVKALPGLFVKWGESYQEMIKASVPHDVLYNAGDNLLDVGKPAQDMLDTAIGEIDHDFNEADGANPVRLALDGEYFIDAAWAARGSGWANTVSDQGWKLFTDYLTKADDTLEAGFAKYPNEGEMARAMIDVELGQGQGKDRMEKWFQLAIKVNPDDYEAYKDKEWYLQPRWYGSPDEILNFGTECLNGGNWSAKVPMILTLGIAKMSDQDTTIYSRPEIWTLVEKTYRSYLEHYPKSNLYRTSFAEHAFDGGHLDIAKEQLTILGNDWDRGTLSPQKYYAMATQLGLQPSK